VKVEDLRKFFEEAKSNKIGFKVYAMIAARMSQLTQTGKRMGG